MKIVVEIETDGDAFGSPDEEWERDQEVARIFGVLSTKVNIGLLNTYPDGFPVRDVNGNTCGTLKVVHT